MKNNLLWYVLALPPVVIILIAVYRREALHHRSYRDVRVLDGGRALFAPTNNLRKAQEIFDRREFTDIKEEQEIEYHLSALISQLPLSEKAQAEANKSCFGIIKAYAKSDWDLFQSIRTPSPGYDVTSAKAEAMRKSAPGHLEGDPARIYREIWEDEFRTNPLYIQVSLPTNAVTLLNLPLRRINTVFFADLGVREGQGWAQHTPMTVFDYTKKMGSSHTSIILRLSFFGKGDVDGASPFMIAFVWDESESLWVPCRMTQGIARRGVHQLRFF